MIFFCATFFSYFSLSRQGRDERNKNVKDYEFAELLTSDHYPNIAKMNHCSSVADYIFCQVMRHVDLEVLSDPVAMNTSTNKDLKTKKQLQTLHDKIMDAIVSFYREMKCDFKTNRITEIHDYRLSAFYSQDCDDYDVKWVIEKLFADNQKLQKLLSDEFTHLNEIHRALSDMYKKSDRFTALLSFPHPPNLITMEYISFVNIFYSIFMEILSTAKERMKLDDEADYQKFVKLKNMFEKDQKHFQLAIISENNLPFSQQNIKVLTYAYVTFQLILYNKKPDHDVIFEVFDTSSYTINYIGSGTMQGKSYLINPLNLNCRNLRSGKNIFEEHFQFINLFLKICNCKSDEDAKDIAGKIAIELLKLSPKTVHGFVCRHNGIVMKTNKVGK